MVLQGHTVGVYISAGQDNETTSAIEGLKSGHHKCERRGLVLD